MNFLLVLLATLVAIASAQWGYGYRGGYGGYGPGYGGYGYGYRPYGPRWGPRPTVIEKTVIINQRPWAAKV